MQLSNKGLALLKAFEGLRLKAYLCSSNKPTIGYGHTKDVRIGQIITTEEANTLFIKDLLPMNLKVSNLVMVPITQNQFDALVCLAFNVGLGALAGSTLLRLLNTKDYKGAADQFLRWDKADGKAVPGLLARRVKERELFLNDKHTV